MKSDIYTQVTDRIIEQLASGVVPWKSPYFSKVGLPRNFSTGRAYQGINVFLLGSQRCTSPFFLTFIQAKELGGHVRKGEKGSLVVKYGTYNKEEAGSTAEEGETRRFLKAYTVFHASQIEGIEFPAPENLPELSLSEKTDRARAIVAAMPNAPAIREGAAVPCYRPATDSVHMPEKGYFESEEAYYSTLFHELAHSTGHASRLARKSLLENRGIDAAGDTARKTYAEEELVAEMGASFLNAHECMIEVNLTISYSFLI
jgi:antirestriction protein ArdC